MCAEYPALFFFSLSLSLSLSPGALVARIILFPMEESTRALFTKYEASRAAIEMEDAVDDAKKSASSLSPTPAPAAASDEATARTGAILRQSKQALQGLIRSTLILGLIFASLGSNYTRTLLMILAGRRWSGRDASGALSAYCVTLPVMAVSGVAEAHLSSVAQRADLDRGAIVMTLLSVLYAVVAPTLVGVAGTTGLLWANGIVFAVRAVAALLQAVAHYGPVGGVDWIAATPRLPILAVFAGAYGITALSDHTLGADPSLAMQGAHVAVGGVAGVVVLAFL
jgi:hypothetical protein